MLGSTLDSVNSALKRARAGVPGRDPLAAGREAPPASGSAAEKIIVTRFMRAWESADLDALVSLLIDDVFMSMPPMPFEYEGRLAVARFCSSIFSSGRHFSLVATRAKGSAGIGRLRARPGRHRPRRRPPRPHAQW